MMGLFKIIKHHKTQKAIKKTQNLMSNYQPHAVVSLPGKKSSYEGYFTWLHNAHPDWEYRVDDVDGMIFVHITVVKK